jgi:GlpG protein
MRPPPPLHDVWKYPVTTLVAAAAIAVTLVHWTGRDLSWAILHHESLAQEPWRALTTVLPHGNFIHLAFNVYWLWVLGTLLEGVWGWWRYALLLVFLGAGSMAAEHAVFAGGIGLSGIGYGLFGLLWVLMRRDPRFDGAIDQATITVFIAWFFLCILLTLGDLMPVANVAHGAGAALGAMIGLCTRPMDPIHGIRRFPASPWLWRLATLTAAGAIALGATVGRPWTNPSRHAGELFDRAYLLLVRERYEEAVPLLLEAVEVQPKLVEAWHNLGIAYVRLDRYDEAVECVRRELELPRGGGEQTRRRLIELTMQAGRHDAQAGRWADAAARFREAAGLTPHRAAAWAALGAALVEAGQFGEAERALAHATELDPADAGVHDALEALRSRWRSINEP